MRANPRWSSLFLLPTLVAGLLLAGCSAGESDEASSKTAGQQADGGDVAAPNAAADEKRQALGGAEQGKDIPAQAPDLSVDQRSIIYRGSIAIRVKDVNAAAGETTGIATTAGGFIGSDNRTSDAESGGTATMTLRVPADKFAATVDRLSKLGKEEHRDISTEDVTEQTVDLDARIAVQQARVDSGRRLLAQAKSLNDLVMLEKEVATRESDLASLQAKKRRLADLTALSTITATLLGPTAASPKPAEPPGFLSGLSAGWRALLGSLKVLLTVLGALLPWLVAISIPLWAALYLRRRFGRQRPGHGAPLAPAGPSLPQRFGVANPAVPPRPTPVMPARSEETSVPGVPTRADEGTDPEAGPATK